jgi:hypothetical protein
MKKQRLDIDVLREAQANLENLAKMELREMLEHLDKEADYTDSEI